MRLPFFLCKQTYLAGTVGLHVSGLGRWCGGGGGGDGRGQKRAGGQDQERGSGAGATAATCRDVRVLQPGEHGVPGGPGSSCTPWHGLVALGVGKRRDKGLSECMAKGTGVGEGMWGGGRLGKRRGVTTWPIAPSLIGRPKGGTLTLLFFASLSIHLLGGYTSPLLSLPTTHVVPPALPSKIIPFSFSLSDSLPPRLYLLSSFSTRCRPLMTRSNPCSILRHPHFL